MKQYFTFAIFITYFLCMVGTSPLLVAQKPATKNTKEIKASPATNQKSKVKKQKVATKSVKTGTSTTVPIAPTKTQAVSATTATKKVVSDTQSPIARQVTDVAPKIATPAAVAATAIDSTITAARPTDTLQRDSVSATAIPIAIAGTPPNSPIQGGWVLLPLLLALGLSLLWRESVLALLVGIAVGAWALNGFRLEQLFQSFLQVFDTHLIGTLSTPSYLILAVFVLMMGGVSALTWYNGGATGWAASLRHAVRSPRSAQMVAWISSLFGYFDPFASAALSGNTARPLTDLHRTSREKLAYIIDTTSTSIASLAVLTTFAGVMIALTSKGITAWGSSITPMSVWLYALQYTFYPIFALLWVAATILWQRDFGVMYRAERRSQQEGKLYDSDIEVLANVNYAVQPQLIKNSHTTRGFYLLLPMLAFVIATYFGIFRTAFDKNVLYGNPATIISNFLIAVQQTNIMRSLLWGAIASLFTAVVLTLLGGRLSMRNAVESILWGMKTVFPALLTLFLALTLTSICSRLQVGEWLIQAIGNHISATSLPFVAFGLAALAAAATGSLTAAVLLITPILLPSAISQAYSGALLPNVATAVFYGTLASVASGALFGAHMSLTSQTSLVSSLSAQCPPIDHVRTQIPYALVVALLSLLAMTVCLWGQTPAWIPLLGGIVLIPFLVRLLGKTIDTVPPGFEIEQNTTAIISSEPLVTPTVSNKLPIVANSDAPIVDSDTSVAYVQEPPITDTKIWASDSAEPVALDVALPVASAPEAWAIDEAEEGIHTDFLSRSDEEENRQLLAALDTAEIPDGVLERLTKSEDDTAELILPATDKELTDNDYSSDADVTEAVSKTKSMFDSMKDIIASVSDDQTATDEDEKTTVAYPSSDEERELIATTEKKMLRYIKEDDEDSDPIIKL